MINFRAGTSGRLDGPLPRPWGENVERESRQLTAAIVENGQIWIVPTISCLRSAFGFFCIFPGTLHGFLVAVRRGILIELWTRPMGAVPPDFTGCLPILRWLGTWVRGCAA